MRSLALAPPPPRRRRSAPGSALQGVDAQELLSQCARHVDEGGGLGAHRHQQVRLGARVGPDVGIDVGIFVGSVDGRRVGDTVGVCVGSVSKGHIDL